MNAGALGIEIIISGKIPSSRAKSWRFYAGYLKKCGDISLEGVNKANAQAKLKTGVVGVKVRIMPPGTKLPDKVELIKEKENKPEVESVAGEEKKKPKKESKIKAPGKSKNGKVEEDEVKGDTEN
jgi:small subunit ribosomal protein S3